MLWDRLKRYILYFLVLVAPIIAAVLSVKLILGQPLASFIPFESDEVTYWHEVATFMKAGLNSGYYGFNEYVSKLPFCHYGPHGPFYAMFYGIPAKIIGWWQEYSAPYYHLGFYVFSLAIFLYVVKPNVKKAALLLTYISTCHFMILMCTSNMMESLHYSFAIVAAAVLYKLLKKRSKVSKKFRAIVFIFILVISIMRYAWALLIFPFLFLQHRRITTKKLLIDIALTVAFTFAVYIVSTLITSPVPFNFLQELTTEVGSSFFGAVQLTLMHSFNNFRGLFHPEEVPLIIGFNVQYFVVMIALIVVNIKFYKEIFRLRKSFWRKILKLSKENLEDPVLLFTLLPILLLAVFFYVPGWSHYRLVSPFFLLCALLIIVLGRRKLTITIIAINLALIPAYIDAFKKVRYFNYIGNMIANGKQVREFTAQLMVFRPEQGPWCNTVITRKTPAWNMYIPAGFGISRFEAFENNPKPLKSKFVVLTEDSVPSYTKILNLHYLALAPMGYIFVNLDADCPDVKILRDRLIQRGRVMIDTSKR